MGRAARIFGLECFPSTWKKEGRAGERREPFHTPYPYFWRNCKRVCHRHKTQTEKGFLFFFHTTTTLGPHPAILIAEGPDRPLPRRRREKSHEAASLLAVASRWAAHSLLWVAHSLLWVRQATCSLCPGGVHRLLLSRREARPSRSPWARPRWQQQPSLHL